MKESFILKLIVFLLAVWLLSSCVGSPVTVQVANDVQGDVVQEAGKVETYSEVDYVPPSAANDRFLPTVMMLGTGFVVIMGLLFIMNSGSKQEKISKEDYYNEW